MSNKIKIILSILVLCILGGYFLINYLFWGSNVLINEDQKTIYIPSNASFDDVVSILKDSSILDNEASFTQAASLMRYNKSIVPGGKYIIKPKMSNRDLIKKLRSGSQAPQQVVINNIRTLSDLAGKASKYFEGDSLTFLSYLKDPANAQKHGFNQETFLTMFIPNTYEMFWTATPEKFVNRMKKEYDKYWTPEKEEKLKINQIDKTQAYIIASIVEKESNYDPERPTIAGVYLNRLKAGEKLQADPTVVYATGDFTIKRVLYSHLEIDSPYNTYKYAGLPPGPICMPSIASLDAVVNAEDHEYLFFCAKADNSGVHAFAKDYAAHQINAAAFAKWMNSLNIR